jgi:hypothetical protein
MRHTIRVAAGLGILVGGWALAACGTSPSPDDLEANSGTTTSTTSTTSTTLPVVTIPTSASGPTTPGVLVPNVIGMKPSQARLVLRSAGFVLVPLNTPCHKGTTTSQSVVSSLSVPGAGQDARIGATALTPGSARPARSRIGVTWSGCYPNGSIVPDVTGVSFDKAVHRLHVAGLAWACFSVPPTHSKHSGTTGSSDTSTSSADDSSTTSSTTTTTTTKPRDSSTSSTAAGTTANQPSVVSQGTKPGTVLKAHTVVDFVMRHCPQ